MSCFVICGCMFILGVLVGRNTAPVQFDVDKIEEQLANLQVSVMQEKLEAENNALPATSDFPVVQDDIIGKLKDRGKQPDIYQQYIPPVLEPKYAKTKPSEKQKKEPRPNTASKTEPAKPPLESAVAAKSETTIKFKPIEESSEPASSKSPEDYTQEKSVKPEKQPESGSTPEPQVLTQPVAIVENIEPEKTIKPEKPASQKRSEKGYAIQVASLKDPDKAKILMQKFKEKGYPAFLQKSEIKGTNWHRVRIGPYPDRALATRDQTQLQAAGVDTLLLIINP